MFLAALLAGSFACDFTMAQTKTIVAKGGGASLPGSVYTQLVETFSCHYSVSDQILNMSYVPTSTGRGKEALLARDILFAGIDVPFDPATNFGTSPPVELPTLVGMVAACVNIPGVKPKCRSVELHQ